MKIAASFFDPATHGFLRAGVAVPVGRVADVAYNVAQTVLLLRSAAEAGMSVVAFPELGLASYTCDDLFHQRALLQACVEGLGEIVEVSAELATVAIVGLPLQLPSGLYNCAAVVQRGRLLGVVPKTYLPNYGEFYELRQFVPAHTALAREIALLGQVVPFGSELVFRADDLPDLAIHVEICEDLWVPIPPSSYAALAGATVLVNLSASNITVNKANFRRQLASQQSARCLAAYLYSSAGLGESTTDLAWDGQALVYENGEMLAESARFSNEAHLVMADIDLDRLQHDRMRQTSFAQSVATHRDTLARWREVRFTLGREAPARPTLLRRVERFPFVPADAARRDERCAEVYNIQVQALLQRLTVAGRGKLVIGVSGGLDSTHALLVLAKAMDLLGRPRSDILGVTMPGFATGQRTLDQALRLMAAIGCSTMTIDIRPSCEQMLHDIGHPHTAEEPHYDVTFENVQAGDRTSHLFRLANLHDGLVVGTGDLSELALGWCTYGVGDHMSHYNVNASVPKTLMKYLVRWVADTGQMGEAGSQVLRDVLETEISPELVPAAEGDAALQRTEDFIGPYELQDFHLFYLLRHGYAPSKIAFLAWQAWRDREQGRFPEGEPQHNQYTLAEIKRHLALFLRRFMANQFKRSCVPNSPKVGSGGSLSPRGDWRAPSDATAATWLAELARVPEDEAAVGSQQPGA